MNNLLQYAGIAALLYFIAQKGGNALANRIRVGNIRMRIDRLDVQFLRARIFMPVINNSPVSIPFDWFRGQLFYANRPLGDVGINRPFTLEANDTVELEIAVEIPLWEAAGNVLDLILAGQYLNSFSVRGNISSNNVIFPVNQNIQII